MATANSAALAAPATPMAKVATGMPLGIWTMECSESTPLRCLPATGTPSTGTTVLAASMPGKCAAPPAPAMIAWSPRATALSAYANMSSGMRCAETTRASKGMANSARMSAAAFIVSQSLADPMTTPTTGEALFKVTPGKTTILAGGTHRALHDRHHPPEFRERPASGFDAAAHSSGHLGALVRPLPQPRPDARKDRSLL